MGSSRLHTPRLIIYCMVQDTHLFILIYRVFKSKWYKVNWIFSVHTNHQILQEEWKLILYKDILELATDFILNISLFLSLFSRFGHLLTLKLNDQIGSFQGLKLSILESFRALNVSFLVGILKFYGPITLQFGEFDGPKSLQYGDWNYIWILVFY